MQYNTIILHNHPAIVSQLSTPESNTVARGILFDQRDGHNKQNTCCVLCSMNGDH
jgi:hypothetical protein